MARVPCSFSAQEDFVARIDARAAELGMKRSEYIVQALRRDLQQVGSSFNVVSETHGNHSPINNNLSTSASGAPGRRPVDYKKDLAKKKKKGN